MAYTIVIQDAFSVGVDEDGWDYQTALELIKKVTEAGLGRVYVAGDGDLTYESRNARTA